VGPGGGLDGRKISFPPEFDPWTVQRIASLYADYAIPAHLPNITSLTGIRVLLYWHIYIYIYIYIFFCKIKIYPSLGKKQPS